MKMRRFAKHLSPMESYDLDATDRRSVLFADLINPSLEVIWIFFTGFCNNWNLSVLLSVSVRSRSEAGVFDSAEEYNSFSAHLFA